MELVVPALVVLIVLLCIAIVFKSRLLASVAAAATIVLALIEIPIKLPDLFKRADLSSPSLTPSSPSKRAPLELAPTVPEAGSSNQESSSSRIPDNRFVPAKKPSEQELLELQKKAEAAEQQKNEEVSLAKKMKLSGMYVGLINRRDFKGHDSSYLYSLSTKPDLSGGSLAIYKDGSVIERLTVSGRMENNITFRGISIHPSQSIKTAMLVFDDDSEKLAFYSKGHEEDVSGILYKVDSAEFVARAESVKQYLSEFRTCVETASKTRGETHVFFIPLQTENDDEFKRYVRSSPLKIGTSTSLGVYTTAIFDDLLNDAFEIYSGAYTMTLYNAASGQQHPFNGTGPEHVAATGVYLRSGNTVRFHVGLSLLNKDHGWSNTPIDWIPGECHLLVAIFPNIGG